jgi:hypothetical protein
MFFFTAEDFSGGLNVLYRGLGISNLLFLIKIRKILLGCSLYVITIPDPDPGPHRPKMLDPESN